MDDAPSKERQGNDIFCGIRLPVFFATSRLWAGPAGLPIAIRDKHDIDADAEAAFFRQPEDQTMRMLTEQQNALTVGGSGEPDLPPPLAQPPGEIDEIIAQLLHLHDRPGTF